MEFWLTCGMIPVEQLVPIAQAADRLGYDGICLPDHLVFPETIQSAYPYAEDGSAWWQPDTPWPDPITSMAAMATATTRLKFSTNVFVLPVRGLWETAKAMSTLACLAPGRINLGVGAGWMREEFELTGSQFDRRGARMEEMIEILRRVWRGGMVEHHGEFYDFAPVQMSPVPPAPIPIWIGGDSPYAYRRAARIGDGWIGIGYTEDQVWTALDALNSARIDAIAKDPSLRDKPFEKLVAVYARPTAELLRSLTSQGVTGYLTAPWFASKRDMSSIDAKIASMEFYADKVMNVLKDETS
ncbi:MAG: TIGR03619 family F420-dependent LLM class oxidoreductase [Acidimicrobiia bacterium]|nr:TIGR03619 family F420-dependent LLM class oxidoreductase [Acidimicrobiia bacterium]